MADITMCRQTLCPNAESCFRVKEKPSNWQSYAEFKYELGEDGVVCDHYLPIYTAVTIEEQP